MTGVESELVEDDTASRSRLLPWCRGLFGVGSGIRRLLRESDRPLALDSSREEECR